MHPPPKKVIFHNLNGLSDYKSTWQLQEKLQKELIESKQNKIVDPAGHLIFCEHPHVYTLGRFGNEKNLLLDSIKLQSAEAEFFHIDRGGDITYHGPGQLVGYPIFNLDAFGMGVKTYIYTMEQAVIDMLDDYGIQSSRLEGATGVWLDAKIQGKSRKICAIGVKVNRSVSMHGFALNINTDLKYFQNINPCGFTDKSVTSMKNELGQCMNFKDVCENLLVQFERLFTFCPVPLQ